MAYLRNSYPDQLRGAHPCTLPVLATRATWSGKGEEPG